MPKYIPPGQEHNYIRRRVRGQEFWVRRSKPKRWSKAQRGHRSRFAAAAAYAKRVLRDPAALAPYAAMAKKRKAWRVFPIITRDFLRPPVVSGIELRDGETRPAIWVLATDDFEVVAVDVVVRNTRGAVLWRGPAVAEPPRWVVTLGRLLAPDEEIVVEATARDRPGHTGTRTERLSVAGARALAKQRHAAQPGILAKRAARKAKRA